VVAKGSLKWVIHRFRLPFTHQVIPDYYYLKHRDDVLSTKLYTAKRQPENEFQAASTIKPPL